MTEPAAEPLDIGLLYRQSPQLWFEAKGVIRLPNGRTSKAGALRANVLQRRIFALHAARMRKGQRCFCIGLKPRKRGFSTAVTALQYTTLAGQSAEGVIVGNKLETSDTVFRMLALMAKEDELARAGQWSSAPKTQTETITWAHGSIVKQSTAHGGESIRGQTPQFVHGTEVAHWELAEDVFLALMNAVPDAPGVSVFLESTPKGRGGAFHGRWQLARWPTADECPDGETGYFQPWLAKCPDQPDALFAEWEFVRVFAAWFEFDEAALRLTDEQKQRIEATLDEKEWHGGERALIELYGNENPQTGRLRLGREVTQADVWEQLAWRRMTIQAKCGSDPGKFDQEYPKDPHTCFLSSGRGVFDSDAIEHYAAETMPPELGALDSNYAVRGGDMAGERATWRRVAREDGWAAVWEHPRLGCRYLIVLDTAEGNDQTGGDNPDRHSGLVFRRAYQDAEGTLHKARVVARIVTPCFVPMHVLVEWVHLLHLYYSALVIPEMNSSGLAYLVGARMRGTPIWKRTDFNPRSGRKEEKLGWRTTDTADYGGIRSVVIENLAAILRARELDFHCPNIVHELGCFVDKNGRREAEAGEHDDDVLALAIGMYKIDDATGHVEGVVERRMPRDLAALLAAKEAGEPKGSAHLW